MLGGAISGADTQTNYLNPLILTGTHDVPNTFY
jgi:hypothetical protein